MWRQELGSGGGQLDREGETIQTVADLRDGRGVVIRHCEGGLNGLRSLDEEPDGLVLGQLLQRRQLSGVRQFQRRHGILAFAPDVQRMPAGDQHGQLRAALEQGGDHRRRVGHVLEVVEHQQQLLRPEVLDQLLDDRLLARLSYPEGLGDRVRHEVRIDNRFESDKEDSIGKAIE